MTGALAHGLLKRAALLGPQREALFTQGQSFTFKRIDQLSDALAAALQASGLQRGDRVAVQLEYAADFVIAMWATMKTGAVFVPINYAAKTNSVAQILHDSEPRFLFSVSAQSRRAVDALAMANVQTRLIEVNSSKSERERYAGLNASEFDMFACPSDPGLIDQDLCMLIYTSGSTGEPKGVMLTHHAVVNNTVSIAAYLEATESDVVLCVLPLAFGYGLFQILIGAHAGSKIVLEQSFAFPAEIVKRIPVHKVTALPGVPSIFTALLNLPSVATTDLSSLRYITNAAAPLSPAHVRQLASLLPGVKIYSMYGLTECTRVAYMPPERLESKFGSVGRAMPNCEAYVADEQGRRVPTGQIGELVVRGSNIMRGYWRRPEATAKAIRIDPETGDRVLHTGDLFSADEEGDLYFVGRIDDMFKCRGERVAPRIVEDALHGIDGVRQAVVLGVDDPADGKAVKAFVILREGCAMTEQQLRRECQRRLESWLVPKFIEFRDSLPQTDSGKVTRRALSLAAPS